MQRKLASDAVTQHRLKIESVSQKRLFLGADLSLRKELLFSDLLSDGRRMAQSREGMRGGVVPQTCSGMHI